MESDFVKENTFLLKQTKDLNLDKRTSITIQVIFNFVKEKLIPQYDVLEVLIATTFLSVKIQEKYLRLEEILKKYEYSIKNKSKILQLEVEIAKIIDYNFEFKHVHYLFLRFSKLGIKCDLLSIWNKIEHIHNSPLIKKIGYLGKGVEPEYIALSLFSEKELKKIELNLFVRFDREKINMAKKIFFEI